MKRYIVIAAAVMLTMLCSACFGGSKQVFHELSDSPEPTENLNTPSPSPTVEPTETPEPTENYEGMAKSLLTGEYVDEDIAEQRPIAVVINNIKVALPQSGIEQAGLYYEVLAEGNITRIIAVFQGAMSEKIGPIRSARDYFIRFALDNGAIFAHHGASDIAYSHIRNMKIENVDGMKFDGSLYWRDPVRVKKSGMYEHSSYSNAANLLEAARKNGYETTVAEDAKPLFSYFDEPAEIQDAVAASKVTVPFAPSYSPYFEYDTETGLYSRFEFDSPHIDEESGNQLTVTNIIIQSVPMRLISGDSYGRRAVDLVGSGSGWLVTNGVYIPIKWSKADDREPTQWFFEDGSELMLNSGKTWICILEPGRSPVFE